VDAEVVLIGQLLHHGIRNAAIADLQRRAVFDHVGHVFADGLLHRPDAGQAHFQYRLAAFHQRGHLRNMQVALAVREGHVRVHFQHDGARLLQGGHRVVSPQAEGEVAVFIHRRGH
jgi:hypothetical protein